MTSSPECMPQGMLAEGKLKHLQRLQRLQRLQIRSLTEPTMSCTGGRSGSVPSCEEQHNKKLPSSGPCLSLPVLRRLAALALYL